MFVHKDSLDFVYQVKLFRKYVAEPVHFTAVLNLDELEPEYNRTLARWRVVAASLKVQLLFLPLSCDRMLGTYYPRKMVLYHYLPASLGCISLPAGLALPWRGDGLGLESAGAAAAPTRHRHDPAPRCLSI